MLPVNYTLFCNQLITVIQRYPNLRIKEVGGLQILKGILDVPDDNKNIIGSFSIEITCSNKFPSRFPILFEVGEDIPKVADWHKYPNNACCITVEPDEILVCKNGINVLTFIENHAIPYFANQIYRKKFGSYKNGEYAHGFAGIKQFYFNLFKTTDVNKWAEYFKIAFNNGAINKNRNDKCFCGSNIKFKNCHDRVFQQMHLLGKEQIINDFKMLYINET